MKIKELRNAKGLTQNALGKMIGVSGQTILNWENGIYEPRISQLIALSDVFGVSIDELVGHRKGKTAIEEGIDALSLIKGEELISWMKKRLAEMGAEGEKEKADAKAPTDE